MTEETRSFLAFLALGILIALFGFEVFDTTLTCVDTISAVDYFTDEHELQVLENGNYLSV